MRDFALVAGATSIDRAAADSALVGWKSMLRASTRWTALSRHYRDNYGGGPVGIETIAAALSEPRDAIEEIIEPFLIQKGFIQRTPRGRLLTAHAFGRLGLAEPPRDPAQFGLFGGDEENA